MSFVNQDRVRQMTYCITVANQYTQPPAWRRSMSYYSVYDLQMLHEQGQCHITVWKLQALDASYIQGQCHIAVWKLPLDTAWTSSMSYCSVEVPLDTAWTRPMSYCSVEVTFRYRMDNVNVILQCIWHSDASWTRSMSHYSVYDLQMLHGQGQCHIALYVWPSNASWTRLVSLHCIWPSDASWTRSMSYCSVKVTLRCFMNKINVILQCIWSSDASWTRSVSYCSVDCDLQMLHGQGQCHVVLYMTFRCFMDKVNVTLQCIWPSDASWTRSMSYCTVYDLQMLHGQGQCHIAVWIVTSDSSWTRSLSYCSVKVTFRCFMEKVNVILQCGLWLSDASWTRSMSYYSVKVTFRCFMDKVNVILQCESDLQMLHGQGQCHITVWIVTFRASWTRSMSYCSAYVYQILHRQGQILHGQHQCVIFQCRLHNFIKNELCLRVLFINCLNPPTQSPGSAPRVFIFF